MAANKHFEMGIQLNLAVASGVLSGDPVVVGNLAGVALTDRDSSGNATVDFSGVYTLSVKGVNDAGNVAVAVGDAIYFVSGDTPKLSKKSGAGILFGYALGAVTSSSTGSIDVKLAGAFQTARPFISTEQTGTGSAQNIAHGLGVIPTAVFVAPTDLTPATVGSYVVTEGTHTSTNVVVTVTTSKKFKVIAIP